MYNVSMFFCNTEIEVCETDWHIHEQFKLWLRKKDFLDRSLIALIPRFFFVYNTEGCMKMSLANEIQLELLSLLLY